MRNKKKLGIVIGRFQLFHNGHKFLIDKALKDCDKVFIFIGSSYRSRNIQNPFSFEERREMIQSIYNKSNKIRIFPLRDYLYDDEVWKEQIFNIIYYNLGFGYEDYDITIYGHEKDFSSYYLKIFPDFNFKEIGNYKCIHSKNLREFFYLQKEKELKKYIPSKIFDFLDINLYNFQDIRKEFEYIINYNKQYIDLIYPPIFQTVDNLVISGDKILLIERGGVLGRGNWALPGGFLEINETLIKSAKRELFEETGLEIDDNFLMFKNTYDNPLRSCLGRMITTCFVWKLDDINTPIKFGDDASKVFWVDKQDLAKNSDKFFDDHYSIIFNILKNQI